jgi:hypothetical protein
VDDTLCAGDSHFEEQSKMTAEKFKSGARSLVPLTFAGINISETDEGYQIAQDSYRQKLRPLLLSASFADFRCRRAQLAWMVLSRPDVCVDVSTAAQVTKDSFGVPDVRALSLAISRVMNTNLTLKYKPLDKESLRLVAFADASFANISDFTSQLDTRSSWRTSPAT